MSVYGINKVCWLTVHDKAFRDELKRDPSKALAALPLDDEERRLLLAGEVGQLHDLGAHSFLLGHLLRFDLFGLTVVNYSERMRAAKAAQEDAARQGESGM